MSTHNYTRTLFADRFWDITPEISREIEGVLPGKLFHLGLSGSEASFVFAENLSGTEIQTLDAAVTEFRDVGALKTAQQERYREIDARTEVLIYTGFEFPPESGLVFSASDEMQRTLTALYTVREHAAITYPITWSTGDDQNSIDLLDAAMVEAFYLTGLGTIRAMKDAGTALKLAVRDTVTLVEVAAIVDSR